MRIAEPMPATPWDLLLRPTPAHLALALAAFLAVWSPCWTAYLRMLPEHSGWLRGERFRYEYRVTGLRSLPTAALTMIVDLEFDGMPDMHVDRVTFRLNEQCVATVDYFAWIMRNPDAIVTCTPDWASIAAVDGDDLRGVFGPYEADPDCGLERFDRLPELESTRLELERLRIRRVTTSSSPSTSRDPMQRVRLDLLAIQSGIVLYELEFRMLPKTLDDLLTASTNYPNGRLGVSELPLDPWGNGYRYEVRDDGFVLWSIGPNGVDERGHDDDIVKRK